MLSINYVVHVILLCFFLAEFHVYLAKVVCVLNETELRKGYRLHCYSTVVCRVHVRPGPSAELNGFLLCCVLRAHLVVAALGADPDEMAENLKSVSLLAAARPHHAASPSPVMLCVPRNTTPIHASQSSYSQTPP